MTNPDSHSDKPPVLTDAPTGVPTAAKVTTGTTDTADKVEDLLGLDAVTESTDREIVQAAWTFLDSPGEKSLDDMMMHATHVGSVLQEYEMAGGEAPDVVNAMYARLELFQRQHHITAAWEELKQPAPDLLQLLYHIRMASSNAASMPAAVGEEIDRLKAAIVARGVQSDTYDRVLELAAVVTETLPHIADSKNDRTAITIVTALMSGNLDYIAAALRFVPKLRADAGKNGPDSQAKLQALADRITGLAEKLQATVH